MAQRFFLQLLPGSVTGGAEAGAVITGEIILEDSDDAYGVINIAPKDAQKIVTVSLYM